MDFISLRRRAGSGGSFKIMLYENGKAAYECDLRFSLIPIPGSIGAGVFEGSFDKKDFARLKEIIQSFRLSEIEKTSVAAFDGVDASVAFSFDENEFEVEEKKHELPALFWLVDKAVQGIACQIRWKKDEGMF